VNRLFSTRQLERAAGENLALIWLLGTLRPDHNSIWRFWRDNQSALREVFKESVRVAVKVGLVGFALQAVDGTKIQAVARRHTGWTKEGMEQKLPELDRVLDQAQAQVQTQETLDLPANRLPAELLEKQALREQIRAGRKELPQTRREHYHPHEPEAHRMQCEGGNRLAHNAQAVADAQANIITAAAVTGQENDVGQFVPMLQAAQANTEHSTACALGDTHYGAAQDLAQAEQAGFAVIAPLFEGKPKGDNPYHTSKFTYDAAADQVICPQGQVLPFQGEKDRRGVRVKVYRCHCGDGAVRAQCTRDKAGRMIEIGPHHATVVAHREALKDPQIQAKLRRRKVIIEPVFATVKQR